MSPHLVYIVTSPLSAIVLLRGQLKALGEQGFNVTVICAPGFDLGSVSAREHVEILEIPMEREINPFKDIISLWYLYQAIRQLKPEIINASTPKAGFLGMLAAKLAGVPVRIYQQRGLRLETTTGLKRSILSIPERLAAWSANWVVCNSNSLMHTYQELGFAPDSKLLVLGSGSSNGIDLTRFYLPPKTQIEMIHAFRQELGISLDAYVIGFVGRLTRDKGIEDLIAAFDVVVMQYPQARLLLVGPLETGDALPVDIIDRMQMDSRIVQVGFAQETLPYYQLMDILAFPSYREGFPNVPLEAAACGVPTVGFRATGTVDAVVDGVTGMLVDVGDFSSLADSLIKLFQDTQLRTKMGMAAQERAVEEFDSRIVWQNWSKFYTACLENTASSSF